MLPAHVRLLPGAVAALLLLALAPAPARASGPYLVDDAAITPAGTGQVETWGSIAGRGHVYQLVPATTLRTIPFLEWSLAFDSGRLDGEAARGLTFQAKALIGPEAQAPGDLAFAVSAAVRGSLEGAGTTDALVNGIVTLMAADWLLLHGNLGYGRDFEGRSEALAWGVRAEATLIAERLSANAEIFGASDTSPGFQLGLRPTVRDGTLDIELVYSRNLGGEAASWATIGFALRF